MGTRQRKLDTGNIGHTTQKDRHGQHWAQDTERWTRVTVGTRQRKIDTGSIWHKTQKIDTVNNGHKTQKDRHG